MTAECQFRKGKQSVVFCNPVYVTGIASVVGKLEGEGPLGAYFDIVETDALFGAQTWEAAESNMQKLAAEHAIQDAKMKLSDIRYLVGGDLLGQLIATTFGTESLKIPMLGLYGACSTMGESLIVAAILESAGYSDYTLAITSSHFAGSEKQFRFPLAYGNQRPMAATWTVTGCGAVVLSTQPGGYNVRVCGATIGKVVDYGVKDSMHMGACMAPAAADTIVRHFEDFKTKPEDYDKIVTGDLGIIGSEILKSILREKGYDIESCHMDCGAEIYDNARQGTDAGGSGCGCAAVTLTAYLIRKLTEGSLKKILFVPTGALLSTVSFNEGKSVPGIAHAVVLSYEEHRENNKEKGQEVSR